jgi:hypothetical protein
MAIPAIMAIPASVFAFASSQQREDSPMSSRAEKPNA